jgi:hypothetical protein
MKNKLTYSSIFLCLLIIAVTGAANAYATTDSLTAAGKVYVSKITYDPAVFFTDDTGTLTVEVTNGNTDLGVVVNHATLSDKNIQLKSGSYDSTSNIGPGKTYTFTFTIAAISSEGTYYPTFSLSFRDADSLFYRPSVRVDNTPLKLTISEKPDAFAQSKKKTVTVKVANPRKNDVRNVILDITGDGVTVTPSKIYIGGLEAGTDSTVNFSVTPDQPTTLVLTLHYDNGYNSHTVATDLPIVFGVDKKQATPIVSNIQVKSDAGIYHVTGDVNNAGLETANAVTVTSLAPAIPEDPYRTYVVGALKPDDFGSFEVTFSAENSARVPLQLSYKDADGNVYTSEQDVKITTLPSSSQKSGNLPVIPIVAAVIIIGVFIGGWVFYLRRNKK